MKNMSTNRMTKEADNVYVLMTDKYRISRNMRAHWYVDKLNTYVSVQPKDKLESFDNEIDLVSILPTHYQDYNDLGSDNQYSDEYLITATTKVTFFSRRYRLAFVLDLSPSVSSVDIQRNRLILDEVFTSMATSLIGLVQPFYVPGSQFLFAPEIFVTVVAYVPFYNCDSHQVLVQGWKITAENIDTFLAYINTTLSDIIAAVSDMSAKAKDERDDDQSESDVLIGSLFEENDYKRSRSGLTLLATPDISMVNMLRFGLLALQLLPDNSSAGIVIITDGMLSLPNANTLESALTQLRQHTISCSFLQTGSSAHPHSALGFIPYTDLMKFISTATFGAYLSVCPEIKSFDNHDFNLYHRAFFGWNFQRGLFGFRADINHKLLRNGSFEWSVDNPYFYSTHDYGLNSSRETRDQQIVRNKQIENTVSAKLTQVLSCRLREGYTIKSVNYIQNENKLEVRLLLPWRHNVNIEYNLSSTLPSLSQSPDSEESPPECHYEVIVEGYYNFLHDVTCAVRKPIKSAYRSATIKQFWTTLKSLSDSDKHEIHLHNFTRNGLSRNIPESIANGVPLFYMPPNSSEAVVSSKNVMHIQFAQYWKWMLDINSCQKWMHTHRINVILEHDIPLPKHLHQPNTSGRYVTVQCRQALSSLNVLLTESSSFVLLENHSYIKLLENTGSESLHSFYLIRVISQPPCVVIHLAFIGGTSGRLRHEIVTKLKQRIKGFKFPKRNISSLNYQKSKNSQSIDSNDANESHKSDRKTPSPLQKQWIDVNCFVVINKSIDKILIRYEKMPKDFNVFWDKNNFFQNNNNSQNISQTFAQNLGSLNMFQTLSRYLYHQRWIWTTSCGPNSWLSSSSLAKILTVLTKMRLQEGFHFAHNDSGILNMIQELTMKDENNYQFSCVVQYIIFPTHVITHSKESLSDDEELDLTEDDGEVQLITECWVEPQHGVTVHCNQRNEFLEGLDYKKISESFFPIDFEAISCLLTFEQTVILCQNSELNSQTDEISNSSTQSPDNQFKTSSSLTFLGSSTPDITSITHPCPQSERIKTIKYCYDIIGLLSKSQQAVVLFSTLFQVLSPHNNEDSHPDLTNELLFELLISKVDSIHDREVKLNQNDCNSFVTQVNQRNDSNIHFFQNPILLNKTNESFGKFRCFCKKLNTNTLLISVVPASYGDLKRLVIGNEFQSNNELLNFHIIDEKLDSNDSHYGSISLPIFVYKTSFTALSDQLIYLSERKRWKDIYLDNTYKSQNANHYPFKTFKTSESENENLSKGSLKQFCRNLQIIYWNCMTQALYKSLQLRYIIDKRDILKIVENICDKIVLNIDISKFLIYICEHLKQYLMKTHINEHNFDINVFIEKHFKLKNEISSKNLQSIDDKKSLSLNELIDSTKVCLNMKELHSDIKEKFKKTLQNFLSPIPSFPSFYFFDCKSELIDNSLSDSNLVDKSLVNSTIDYEMTKNSAITAEPKANTTKSDDSYSYSTLKSFPKSETLEESVSLSKSNSSKVSNQFDLMSEDMSLTPNLCTKTETSNADTYLDTSSQPLFLRLSCSIQTQFGTKECSLNFLPTCVQDFIDLIDCNISETNLEEIKVSLNLICLTQSDEINASSLVPMFNKRDSVVSNEYQNISESMNQCLTEVSNNEKLSEYQFKCLNECVDKIEWLLTDEIVSIALDSYPICESTLEMVIKHIENSPFSDFCFKKQVALEFVYGTDNNVNYDISLSRFCESIGQIKLPGFALKKVGKYYYISYEKEPKDQSTDSQKCMLRSIIPTLSSDLSFHFNDAVLPIPETGKQDLSNTQTNEMQNNSNLLQMNKRNKSKEYLSDDSLEDDVFDVNRKRQLNRKHIKSRSASVPPNTQVVENKRRKAGHSLPEMDFEFESKPKITEEMNENEKYLTNTEENDEKNVNLSHCSENENIGYKSETNGEEEGYEGDSDDDSDVESENWIGELDSKQPLAPKFWLIMKINSDSVDLYFHTRPKDTSSESYNKGIDIFKHVIVLVETICKTVNQMLLLKDLHDTRMCDDLLVPLEDNEPWSKNALRSGLNRTQLTQSTDLDTDIEINSVKGEHKLTKTNSSFNSGSFACDIVWKKHFPLHPRLQSGPSRGILAMKTFLNSFSVNNRLNLFVYQESLNSVFYLRLYEINCSQHNYNKDMKSLNCSESPSESSLQFLQSNKRPVFDESSEFRNRIDSNVSDKDRDNKDRDNRDNDSISLNSFNSSNIMRQNSDKHFQYQCILLQVHGIREVGKDIKEEMVGALQKKLDEAVLELLIIMLSRNPHSKLTPEDVVFIQKCYKEPTETFKFTIDSQYIPFIHSIKVYLRQNLLTVMHNPKYIETNPEFHFKIYKTNDSFETNDFDTFLYYRQQAFGSDSKGIACIILSLVDGNGDIIPHNSCSPLLNVGHTELKPLLAGCFDEVTKCDRYNSAIETKCLIQFHIWSVGKIDLQELSRKLQNAIKHSVWDLILEFKLLRASLNNEFEFTDVLSSSLSVSEPSTPKTIVNTMRGRRTGRSTIESYQANPLKRLDLLSKDMSSSVPNIFKSNENVFKFPESDSKLSEIPNRPIITTNYELNKCSEDFNDEELANLSCILNLLVRPWLDYGRHLEVISVMKQQYSVSMRHSVPNVIKEFKNYVQNLNSHMTLNAFKQSNNFMYIPCNDFEFFDQNSEFECITNAIILVRHERLWRTTPNTRPTGADSLCLDQSCLTKSERPKFRFYPHFCNYNTKTTTLLNETTKSLSAISNSSLNSNISENKSLVTEVLTCFAPRQKFLLLYIEDKVITLYLYNWSNEYLTNICKSLSNIVSWHNSRAAFLKTVISQKAGIFHNQPFRRKSNSNQFNASFGSSVKTTGVVTTGANLNQYFKNQKQRFNSFSANMNENIDLLIKHNSPVTAAQEYSQNKKLFPQISGSFNLSKCFRNRSDLTPIQSTSASKLNDLVQRFGKQIKFSQNNSSKELQELSKIWHIQGNKLHFNPILDRIIKQVKHMGRLNHYCLTPLLFSPKWRQTVSPVRDHSLQTSDDVEDVLLNDRQRLRHASGGYVRKTDDSEMEFNRNRRLSGPPTSSSVSKPSADESWHFAVCSHYIQEYVQYLQTLGFGAIQMRTHRVMPSIPKQKSENALNYKNTNNKGFSNRKLSTKTENERYFLIKSLTGGLLVFEVGFSEPYVFSHLYSFDAKRFEISSRSFKWTDTSLSQTFLDELDRIKVTMHLHSFTYDYHLRTIHSYISGRQLIFRQGYHLTSFLDDFIKYYQKAPNYARNYVHLGQISIHNICVNSQQLYNYIISHNDLYSMKVFRMNSPVYAEEDTELTNEYVLVELSSHRVPYKDMNDIRQVDNFDVGVLITHDCCTNQSHNNTLSLKFFVLLTSQRELFPKLFSSHFGPNSKGVFKPIRLYSSQPSSGTHSRKSSVITDPNLSDGSFTDNSYQSTRELTASTSSVLLPHSLDKTLTKSIPMLSTSAGICDEEITYLGYFSSHETMMLQILQDRAKDTEQHLTEAVKRAAIDCRRELLWTCLLPRKTSESEDFHLTVSEFEELLSLVDIIRLDEYDNRLAPFTGLHISFYQSLAKTMVYKIGMSYRNFSSPDSKSIKLVMNAIIVNQMKTNLSFIPNLQVFIHSNCFDCFILLNINTNTSLAEICLVFKKQMTNANKQSFLESCSTHCHTLVEEFVNGCAYYMWSQIT